MKKRLWGILMLVVILITFVYCVLAGAEAGMIPNTTMVRCDLKFPKWFGCVLSNHENLAGGLIGAFGTVLAGLVAWIAVQNQIAVDREIANQSDAQALNAARESINDHCELFNEFWRAVDFVLVPNLSPELVQERYRFLVATLEAYESTSLPPLDVILPSVPIAKRNAFSTVVQHLKAIDNSVSAIVSNPHEQDEIQQVRMVWIQLSSLEAALSHYDTTLAALFRQRRKASIESRTAATLIRPFVDEHVRH